jgi:hypothetical protein
MIARPVRLLLVLLPLSRLRQRLSAGMPQLAVTVVPGAIVMAPVVPLMQTSPE